VADSVGSSVGNLGSITVNATVIPEPGSFTLLAPSLLGFLTILLGRQVRDRQVRDQ
jgi:hypothetical protein